MEIKSLTSPNIQLSRTGYTGEEGYEIFAPVEILPELWENFLEQGRSYGLEPCGLGARDLLRLEMGYSLYGHELSEEISPIESFAAWAVHLSKPHFLGKEAIEQLLQSKKRRYPLALRGKEQVPAREGYAIFSEGVPLGIITSGGFSPIAKCPIALGLVDRKIVAGETVQVEIRGRLYPFETIKLPFI